MTTIDALPPMRVHWVDATHRLPLAPGKYVVEIDCGGGLGYTTTRSYNPTHTACKGWVNMLHGESVTHWLEGLRTPHELHLQQLRRDEGDRT